MINFKYVIDEKIRFNLYLKKKNYKVFFFCNFCIYKVINFG